ncbi:MAG: hypothetical protein ACE5JI_20120, partial [Acidobacteriota bacterium]
MRRVLPALTLMLSSVFLLDASGVPAMEGAETAHQTTRPSEEEIAQAFDLLAELFGVAELTPYELKRKVEDIGLLRFRRDVPIEFMTRERLARYIRELFEEEYPRDVAEREERMLRALGFLDPGDNLRRIRERVLNESIAGFYDERPRVRRLFAILSGRPSSKLGLMNQLVLAHELRHALQDQHVDLRRLLGEGSDFDDRRLATLALLEGDATLLMEKYMGNEQGSAAGSLGDLFGGAGDGRAIAEMFAGPELRGAPPVVREQLLVPYLEGRQLAAQIFQRGGFALLNRKLADPPRSMEQVLHPEKYLGRRDEPVRVRLGEVSGGRAESEGRVGEFFIRVLLEALLSGNQARQAAAGWGGDSYAVWKTSNGSYRLLWRTVWDSDHDAGEF